MQQDLPTYFWLTTFSAHFSYFPPQSGLAKLLHTVGVGVCIWPDSKINRMMRLSCSFPFQRPSTPSVAVPQGCKCTPMDLICTPMKFGKKCKIQFDLRNCTPRKTVCIRTGTPTNKILAPPLHPLHGNVSILCVL